MVLNEDVDDGHDDRVAAGLPCAPELLQELLRQLDKTVRLHQLYPITNPTYLKTLDALRAAFRAVWEETGAFMLQVSETQFRCANVVVLDEPEKASDSLPWTLFKDGVRQVALSRGFEDDELEALLDIIPKVRRAQDADDDVLTLFWAQEFEHLTYRFIDTVSSEGAPLDASATPGRWPATTTTVRADPRAAIAAARQRAAQGRNSIDTMLRASSAPDAAAAAARAEAMRHLQQGVANEYSADLRRDITDVLLDIFELQRDNAVRLEIAGHLNALLLLFLSSRAFASLAHLLRESTIAVTRAAGVTDEVRRAVEQLSARLSDEALLEPLLEWVDAAADRPTPATVAELLARVDASALGAMFRWSAESRHHELRLLYAATAERLAETDPSQLVKLVNVEHESVALEAIRRCGAERVDGAVVALVRALGNDAEARRAAALAALANIGTPRALAGVERAMNDRSAAVRTAAVRVLTVGSHRPALPRVTEAVQSRDARAMDGNERRALFELFGTLCGEAGVPWLTSQLVGPKGFFKRKSDPETRACAAAALGRVNTASAREALRAAADAEDPLVRRAVRAALARGEEG
jgi:HEAT repeat protein